MFSLVYVSSAAKPFSHAELIEILDASHRNNAALGVTGMLLYKDGNVMQVLEGEEPVVRELYAKIGRDPRHHGLLTLTQGTVPKREFDAWTMGFRDLSSDDSMTTEGYTEFMNTPLTDPSFLVDPKRAHRLLTTFKQGR